MSNEPIYRKISFRFISITLLLFIIFPAIPLYSEDKTDADDFDGYQVSPPLVPTPEEYGKFAQRPKNEEEKLLDLTCGNKVIDPNEQCDDGNRESGDGCSSRCSKEESICGNGKAEEGEACGEEGMAECEFPAKCESCQCVAPEKPPREERRPPPRGGCGNGILEQGEECNEPGLSCSSGFTCSQATCLCVSAACGDGKVDQGETCGEPGLAVCPEGQLCEGCICISSGFCGDGFVGPGEACDDGNGVDGDGCTVNCEIDEPSDCGTYSCPGNSACQISYCRLADGTCEWSDITSVGGPPPLQPHNYGNVAVPECCATIAWQSFVARDPCSGEVVNSRVDVTSIGRTGGSSCVCPLLEQSAQNDSQFVSQSGEIVGCSEAIDPGSSVSANIQGNSIEITCQDCCGNLKTTQASINVDFHNTTPVSCPVPANCPS